MNKEISSFEYLIVDEDELDIADKEVLLAAKLATERAYAPYSNFKVGAAALLTNGQLVIGSNQENASFPAGICAERVLIASIVTNNPEENIKTIAISYNGNNVKSDHPISPCGICRQVLAEYEVNAGTNIKLILSGMTGKIFIIHSLKDLLPFSFTKAELIN
ncbi:MAG: cytidine deaminase [Chitinophagaceae bacterium]